MAKAVNWNNVDMLTNGLKNLGNQFNERWQSRDGASDGAIGDYAHTQENSGHNPDDTSQDNAEWDSDSDNKSEVRAIDVDSDLGESGTTMQMVIDHLRSLPNLSSVIRYMIYNRKMYHVNNSYAPTTYTGASAHTEHAHFSGAWTNAADENTTFNFKFEEVGNMALTDADKNDVANLVVTKLLGSDTIAGYDADGNAIPVSPTDPTLNTLTPRTVLERANKLANVLASDPAKLRSLRDLPVTVTGLSSKLDQLLTLANAEALEIPPTAAQNAQAVVDALGDTDVDSLADVLRNGLSPEKLAELKAVL